MITTTSTYAIGISGKRYDFNDVHEIGIAYKTLAGVYMFLIEGINGMWIAVYVGECVDFNERLNVNLTNHHRWQCIKNRGATHIATLHVPGDRQVRLDIETDLREALNPTCNRQ